MLFRCAAATALLALSACAGEGPRYGIQWDATDQIWLSEESQVKVRAAQSRVFDGSDRESMLEAVIVTLQDAGFQIEVLDETLGIVSGKKYLPDDRLGNDPTYYLYDEESLVVFTRAYRSWGPFYHRSDLVRLTVTVRPRNESQLIVRASAQLRISPVEEPLAYQRFFRALEQALFSQRQLADQSGRRPASPIGGKGEKAGPRPYRAAGARGGDALPTRDGAAR